MAFAQEAPTADDISAAAEQFDLGRKAFKSKEYVEAAEHFEAADTRAPSAPALQLAIRSRDRAGQAARAATLSALALERHPDQRDLTKLAQDVIDRAQGELYVVNVACNEPCALIIDTTLVHGRPGTARRVYFTAGNYNLRASWSKGRTKSEAIEASAGATRDIAFEAPPLPEPERQPQPQAGKQVQQSTEVDRGVSVEPKHGWSPIVFIVGAGLTALAGGATVWSGIDTMNNPGTETVRAKCSDPACPEYQEGLDHQRRTNILIGVTAGLGLGTAAIGALLTDWSRGVVGDSGPGPQRAARVRVDPWLSVGSGATLGAQGMF